MKVVYFDCSSGISGDMCLGAVVDAGITLTALEKELKKISVGGYRLTARKVNRAHFVARKVDVVENSKKKVQGLKKWQDVEKLIDASSLDQRIRKTGLNIFRRIFEAEARVHGRTFDSVHLHELGAIDCMVDIFGTVAGLALLGIEAVYSSPINLGRGFVKTEAGILPLPAPATAEILKKVPVYSTDLSYELTTPTGAAIIKELSSGFGALPAMEVEKIGTGAGERDFADRPNILRLFIGNQVLPSGAYAEMITVIEATIDDMNPQIYEYVMERLFGAGARDVYLSQIIMKKGRPGIKLTALCNGEKREDIIRIIMRETSTIGLRFHTVERRILRREVRSIGTKYGKIKMKFALLGDDVLKVSPEYEECKRIAQKFNIPLIEVMKNLQ